MIESKSRVAIYCRLSEEDRNKQSETDDSNSIQNQKSMLLQYSLEHGWEVYNIYSDDDYTGSDRRRPEFNRLLEDAKNRKFDIVLCKTQSRFTRELELVEKYIHGLFPIWGIRFISIVDNADTANKGNKKSRQINGLVNEWYLEDMSENIKSVLTDRRKNGHHIGAFALYGYKKDPDVKGHLIIDEEAAEVVREVFTLFSQGYGKTAIARMLNDRGIPNPTEYKRLHGLRYKQPKTKNSTLWKYFAISDMLVNEIYIGNMVQGKYGSVSYKTKQNKPRPKDEWYRVEGTHEPIIDRTDFETVQRILENAPVKRPNGDGEIHPLSGLLFCKDCGAKMHIRIDYRNGGKRHVAYCSEYHKGKAKNPKCNSPHIIDADLLMQTIAEVLKKIEDYSISNWAEFEALVKKNLAMQQTDKTKKQQKRIPQITTRLEQIDKVLNKLYEDNALGTIPQDRYEQMSQKYSEEYYALKAELAELQEQLSAFENAGGRAQKFLKLTERYAAFTDLTPAILNEFISRIEVHERDKKRAKQAIQHIGIYFNYIGKFENEVTQLTEPTEQEIRQMREEIEEAKKEKSRAYHRQYSREYRARNLEKQREYDRIKAREYRARRKAQTAAAQPAQ